MRELGGIVPRARLEWRAEGPGADRAPSRETRSFRHIYASHAMIILAPTTTSDMLDQLGLRPEAFSNLLEPLDGLDRFDPVMKAEDEDEDEDDFEWDDDDSDDDFEDDEDSDDDAEFADDDDAWDDDLEEDDED